MENPDLIFEEPWSAQIRQDRGNLQEFIKTTENAWSKAVGALPRVSETLEKVKKAAKELSRIKLSMEEAKEEVQRIEKRTEEAESDVKAKREALSILDEIVESIRIPKEELQMLQEPAFSSMQEMAIIEEALRKARKCLSLAHPRAISICVVKERQEAVKKVLERFDKKAKEFIIRDCLKSRRSPTDVHELLSRYTEVIAYLVQKDAFQECMHAYMVTMAKLHKTYMAKKIEEVLAPFRSKRAADKEALVKKIESIFITMIQLMFSLAATEGYFLTELFAMREDAAGKTLSEIFQQAEQEISLLPGALYDMGYEVGVLNLLCSKFSWLSEPASPSEEMAVHRIDSIVPKIKKELHELEGKYLQKVKKAISKEYSRDGAIDLDKAFYNVVDVSAVPSLNTEVLRMNLAYSSRMQTQMEKVFQTVKRACILGSMQAHYLENKEKYKEEVDEQLNEEIEKMASNLMYLAESKVFEKDKTSSIVKRTKEIMDLLNKVEDPLGFRLQIDFKDMVLSKANFHEKNAIAAVLTANKKEGSTQESASKK
ncbi:uncharacterized protein NEMAJ01_1150 [Nematocida major]|uniref:uncharacterized protein n=1 Tax=Nematocida major TaxID=1912982 RepID=UPI0020089D63|nr:uncharacterized protein NEMAJ01_1150 [Nematocida major]KAH9386254.1 hypothetical protein NEMAJ01_1150 [Nematocida major]